MYRLVHSTNVENYWSKAAPWIAQAIGNEPEDWRDLENIHQRLISGMAQLWLETDEAGDVSFVMITEGMMLGADPTLVIRWMSGRDIKARLFDVAILENWALHSGFKKIQAWCRPGFERLLKPLCYKKSFLVLEKTLERGLH